MLCIMSLIVAELYKYKCCLINVHEEIFEHISDCSEPCPGGGTWNAGCTWCDCPSNTLTGRVLTSVNTPLSGVNISAADSPFISIAITDAQGSFSIPSICVDQNLLFQKEGYDDQTYEVTALLGPVQISLMKIGDMTHLIFPIFS